MYWESQDRDSSSQKNPIEQETRDREWPGSLAGVYAQPPAADYTLPGS
jgi:hypothetical protein